MFFHLYDLNSKFDLRGCAFTNFCLRTAPLHIVHWQRRLLVYWAKAIRSIYNVEAHCRDGYINEVLRAGISNKNI